MKLIACYRNTGFESVADGAIAFFDRRTDLHQPGVVFGDYSLNSSDGPAKVSTDISLVAIDRSDPESFALSEVIVRGVSAALDQYLHPLIAFFLNITQRLYITNIKQAPRFSNLFH